MYSIKRRIIITIILGSALVLACASVFLDAMIGFEMQRELDNSLLVKARALESLVDQDNEGIEFDFTDEIMPEFGDQENPQYFQLWINGNTVFSRSKLLPGKDLAHTDITPGQHKYYDITLPDGRPGRQIETTFLPRIDTDENDNDDDEIITNTETSKVHDQQITLVLARERVSLDERRFIYRLIISVCMIVVLLILTIIIAKYVTQGFLPVTYLAKQVGDIDVTTLDQRIATQKQQSIELSPIKKQINRLLDRLESAYNREKQFSADLAHELRTPVAELKSLAQVAQMRPEDRDTIMAFFGDVENISQQMEKTLSCMLELARFDAHQIKITSTDIALGALVDTLWHKLEPLPGGTRLKNNIPDDLVIHSDVHKLELILTNLLANAAVYSPSGATVTVVTEQQTQGIRLLIINPVTNLEQADISHMTERFWRKEIARSDARHSGLGLTLVDAMAKSIGIDMVLHLDDKKIFSVSLSLFLPASSHHVPGK